MKKPSRLVVIVILAVVVIAIILLVIIRKPKEKTVRPEARPVPVAVRAIMPRPLPDIANLPGRVEADVDVTLGAEKPGAIMEIAVEKGDAVAAGQLLLRLDDRTWVALYDKSEIDLREAQKDLDRWEELKKAGAVSVNDYEDIRTRQELARIARNEAQVQLDRCRVQSPIAGQVADRFVERGAYATEGMPLFRVVRIDPVKVRVDIPERDIRAVTNGQPAELTADALPGVLFTGRVSFVAPAAGRDNNAFPVEITIPNPDHRLKPGMIARVRLERRVWPDAIAVPLTAVVPQKGEYVVFIHRDGKAERRLVQIEALLGNEAVLATGVNAGEEVIVEGARSVMDGSPVAVSRAPETPAP